jgi:hypothetical protein
MRDAELDNWKRDSQIPAELHLSLRALNYRFLELITALPPGWDPPRQGVDGAIFTQIAELSSAQRAAAANCPYALFDLHFHDEAHWRARLGAPVGFVAEPILGKCRDAGVREAGHFLRMACRQHHPLRGAPSLGECTRARSGIFNAPVSIVCRHWPPRRRLI